MRLFDFFKKKETNPSNNLTQPIQKAFEIIFPNGVADHEKQVNELFSHFGGKYEFQEVDSNLVYVLTGYLITGNTQSRENAISQVLNRPNNRMSKNDVEYLYNFAIKNHPKLSQLLIAESMIDSLSADGCDTDTIPGGSGYYGLSPKNPIPTKGVIGIYDYLARLYDEEIKQVTYERTGAIINEVSAHPIDVFQITSSKGVENLYFSGYHKRTSELSPIGYILVDSNNTIISSGNNRDFPLGYKLTPTTKTLPKLFGLGIFTCFSDKELVGMDEYFSEAERINRQAIYISNNGNFEEALEKLEYAISKGSLNAVNNKFTVLHTCAKYDEAVKFLESIVDTTSETAQGLYNLAVLYHNADYDTNYHVDRDIVKVYRLLIKAANLPKDKREEYRTQIQDKANALIIVLENADVSLRSLKDMTISTIKSKQVEKTIPQIHDFKIQSATPTTDIYGGKLMERLPDIYSCIHAAAEEMANQMVAMPKLGKNGMSELEIIFAGILSHNINQHIVIQALLHGNPKFFDIEASNLGGAMESYKSSYESQILCTHIKKRIPLMEFARSHGKLKLKDIDRPDKSGNLKAPIFVLSESEIITCRFYFFDKEEQTADYIVANKNDIYIDITQEGEYLFKLRRDINWWYDEFMKYIAYYIYVSPLNYHYYLHGDDIEDAIKDIKRGKTNVLVGTDITQVKASDFEENSNILSSISYALNEGIRTLDVLASSTGLIGEYNS